MRNKILAFTASWCAPCKAMKPALEQFSDNEITVYDVDKDRSQVKTYKVTAVPTFVIIDSGGDEVSRHLGSITSTKLRELLNVKRDI